MQKSLALGVGIIGGAVVVFGLASGTATADDGIVGKKYSEASATLSKQGKTAVVATTLGDRKDRDDCIVSSASPAPFKDGYGGSVGSQVLVNLNCYGTYGTALYPGLSIGSPEGRELHDADVAAAKKKQAADAAAASGDSGQ